MYSATIVCRFWAVEDKLDVIKLDIELRILKLFLNLVQIGTRSECCGTIYSSLQKRNY